MPPLTNLLTMLTCRYPLVSWLLVLAICSASETSGKHLSKVACENKPLVLDCPQGQIIRIKLANYGRYSMVLCNEHGQTDNWVMPCTSRTSHNLVAERCDGKQTCRVMASNQVFDNPCPNTDKYLDVTYLCEQAVTKPPPTAQTGPGGDQRGGPISIEQPNLPGERFDGSPTPPDLLYVYALNATAAVVEWYQAAPSSPIKGTSIYYINTASKERGEMSVSNTWQDGDYSSTITGLQPNTTYVIYLKSYNTRGVSDNSNTMQVTMPALVRIPSTTTRHPEEPGESGDALFPGLDINKSVIETTTTSAASRESEEGPERGSEEHPPSYTEGSAGRGGNGRSDADDDDDDADGGLYMCPPVEYRGVQWPRTRPGHIVERMCPREMRGMSSWQCVGHAWAGATPDLSDCLSPWLSHLDGQVHSVMQLEEEPMTAMMALHEGVTTEGRNLLPGDLKKAASKLLPKLAQGMMHGGETAPGEIVQFNQAFVSTTSELLSPSHSDAWQELSTRDRRRSATSLVMALEDTGFTVASNLDVGDSRITSDKNVVLMAHRVDTQTYHSDLTFPSPGELDASPAWKKTSDCITIPSTSLKIAGRRGPLNIVFTVYNNLEDLIQPQQENLSTAPSPPVHSDGKSLYNAGVENKPGGADESDENAIVVEGPKRPTPRIIVNSRIIGASIESSKLRRKLPEPIRFTLEHLHVTENVSSPLCSFWEMDTAYLSGRWSQDGCRWVAWNRSHTVCECDHLTNFAVLMDITGVQLSEEHELALRVVTYVGCIISIVCLLLAWITFTIFKNLQCDRNTIHKNLVLTLLLAEVLFVVGIAQTQPKWLCSLIAAGLHYLFLAAFAWMCLEGIQLYVMLVQVFEHERSRVMSYYLFGYGIPLAVVVLSAAVYHEGYGTDKHCWLTTEKYFILSFVAPACAVVGINLVMLSIAIYTMCRHSHMTATMKERSKGAKFSMTMSVNSMETFAPPKLRFPELPAWLKGALVLVVLLGLTWAFGLLYLNQQTVVLAYVFTIFNSLQGFFIFVFHCLKNEKVQKEYRKVARHTTWLPTCVRVNYGGYTVRASSSRQNSTGSGNYLSKLFGLKRRSATLTNSSAKPFLSTDQQRKSDIDNSASGTSANRDSSSIPPPSPHPTLLNGYIYNPSYTHLNGYTTPVNSSTGVVVAPHTNNGCPHQIPHQLAPCYEEVVGELSQVFDCSVIDSEMVSEYCHNNMQVSQEKQRYSTGSEDSVRLLPTLPLHPPPYLDPDNLSTVSVASSSLVQTGDSAASTQALPSSQSLPPRSVEEEPVYEEVCTRVSEPAGASAVSGEGGAALTGFDPHLNLHQYIIPSSRSGSTSTGREKHRGEVSLELQASARRKAGEAAAVSRENYLETSTSEMSPTDRSSSSPDVQFPPDSSPSPCSTTDKSDSRSQP